MSFVGSYGFLSGLGGLGALGEDRLVWEVPPLAKIMLPGAALENKQVSAKKMDNTFFITNPFL